MAHPGSAEYTDFLPAVPIKLPDVVETLISQTESPQNFDAREMTLRNRRASTWTSYDEHDALLHLRN